MALGLLDHRDACRAGRDPAAAGLEHDGAVEAHPRPAVGGDGRGEQLGGHVLLVERGDDVGDAGGIPVVDRAGRHDEPDAGLRPRGRATRPAPPGTGGPRRGPGSRVGRSATSRGSCRGCARPRTARARVTRSPRRASCQAAAAPVTPAPITTTVRPDMAAQATGVRPRRSDMTAPVASATHSGENTRRSLRRKRGEVLPGTSSVGATREPERGASRERGRDADDREPPQAGASASGAPRSRRPATVSRPATA